MSVDVQRPLQGLFVPCSTAAQTSKKALLPQKMIIFISLIAARQGRRQREWIDVHKTCAKQVTALFQGRGKNKLWHISKINWLLAKIDNFFHSKVAFTGTVWNCLLMCVIYLQSSCHFCGDEINSRTNVLRSPSIIFAWKLAELRRNVTSRGP